MKAAQLALAAALALGGAGCSRAECTATLATGRGSFEGVAKGRRTDAALQRAAVHEACSRMCAGDRTPGACASRCTVDALDAATIGVRVACRP